MKSLEEIFQSFETGIRSAKAVKPKKYLEKIELDYNTQRIGFNSGQFHHRATPEIKKHYENLGLLTKSNVSVREEDMEAYSVFGRYGIVFPLLDSTGRIVNLYAIRFEMASPLEQYLNDEGIFPSYPAPNTQRLLLVPSVIDAASLIQSRVMENRDAVMALHDGKFTETHRKAIQSITELKEILLLKY